LVSIADEMPVFTRIMWINLSIYDSVQDCGILPRLEYVWKYVPSCRQVGHCQINHPNYWWLLQSSQTTLPFLADLKERETERLRAAAASLRDTKCGVVRCASAKIHRRCGHVRVHVPAVAIALVKLLNANASMDWDWQTTTVLPCVSGRRCFLNRKKLPAAWTE
jgi:hypothetical protein